MTGELAPAPTAMFFFHSDPEPINPFARKTLETVESRYRLAWRAGGLGLLLSVLGTAIGYLFMVAVCFSSR